MKIRNSKKKTYYFYPHSTSNLKGYSYKFKNKKSLMGFLNGNFDDALNGTVDIFVSHLNQSYTERNYFVWYNEFEWKSKKTNKLKIVLKQQLFRGRKFISRHRISKEDKKYFSLSDKIFNLMLHISKHGVTNNNAKNLVSLFYKCGWVNKPLTDEYDIEYSEHYSKEEPEWWYWSDRCHTLRMKIIYEYFKRNNLI